jgi:hypothetical protein
MTTRSATTKGASVSTTTAPRLPEPKEMSATVASQMNVHLRRGSSTYNMILKAAQWQRDNYLMGQEYADRRQEARPRRMVLPRREKVDTNALGLIQLSQLGASFIPSPTVKQALMPIVLAQPCTSLYQPAKRGLVSLIDSQQANVDALVRQSLLNLLEQERVKKLVMNSTKGYIADSAITASSQRADTVHSDGEA